MSRKKKTRRTERRFVPQSAASPWLVRVLGGLGAALLGAGVWATFYGHVFAEDEKLHNVPSYLTAAGAVLLAAAIWIGTSSAPPVRVGDPGLALEKGDLKRVPWWGLEKLSFDEGAVALVVTGKDESGSDLSFSLPVKAYAEAVGWVLKETLARVPKVVDVPESVLEQLPAASTATGELLELEPLQVVGKRCASTGKTISYEPDARVCTRCERVYLKKAAPKKCKCGATFGAHGTDGEARGDDNDNDDAPASQREEQEAEE